MTFSGGGVPAENGSMKVVETVLAAALPQLKHLTFFGLERCLQSSSRKLLDFAPISVALGKLQQLQILRIGKNVTIPQVSLSHLPVSLHTLWMSSHIYSGLEAPASYPTQLASLHQLQLNCVSVPDPIALLGCTQLTHLELWDVRYDNNLYYGTDGFELPLLNLLATLAELKRLQHLDLHHSLDGRLSADEPYTAITASSQLTHLSLSSCYVNPSAAWEIFVPGRCDKLVELHVAPPLLESPGSYELLVSCCPALQYLEVKSCEYLETDQEVGCAISST